MSDFDKFVSPDLLITIDEISGTPGRFYGIRFDYPTAGNPPFRPLPANFAPGHLQTGITRLRQQLTSWAHDYGKMIDGSGDNVSFNPDAPAVKEVWTGLAKLGSEMYRLLFDLDLGEDLNLNAWSEKIKRMDVGSRIQFEAPKTVFPWVLLYDDDVPKQDDPAFYAKLKEHFWGFRYQVEALPPYSGFSYFGLKPYLNNTDRTRLSVAVNEESDSKYKTEQMRFFRELEQTYAALGVQEQPGPFRLSTQKTQVITSMRERLEPQHLYYFFCHHKRGDGTQTIFGTRDIEQRTEIIMEGEDDGIITLEELVGERIQKFNQPPLIFLNACGSGQHEIDDPHGFMSYFIGLGSFAYIGTEAEVPALFADAYGRRFIDRFLKKDEIGKILFDCNRSYAEKYNPFGLYYMLYGLGQIHLNRAAEVLTK